MIIQKNGHTRTTSRKEYDLETHTSNYKETFFMDHLHNVNEIVSLSESYALHSNWSRSSCSINIAGYILNKPWSWETPNAIRPSTSYITKPGTIVPFPNHHVVDESSSSIHCISIRTSDPLPTIIELLSCLPVGVSNVTFDEPAPN